MSPSEAPVATSVNRWVQLVAGIICMVMIANLQYGWTYFVDPIDAKYHWGRTSIQVAFTIFVATETWLVPVEGWFVDRFGPRLVVMFGGVVVAIAWSLNCVRELARRCSTSPRCSLASAPARCYGTCVGNALKWFADRRGLAAGLTAAGFGAGAAATVVPIITRIKTYGYDKAFLWFGIGQGIVILVLSQFLKAPRPGEAPAAARKVRQSTRDYRPSEMLRTPLFWILYVMFTTGGGERPRCDRAGGADRARLQDRDSAGHLPVHSARPSLVMAGIIDNILNGLARPTFGWVSDHIGRENTMAIVFTCGAGAYWATGHDRHVALGLHRDGRSRLLHLGRNLQPLSGPLHGHLRSEVHDDECRAAVHGERHGGVSRAGGRWLQQSDRELARRLRRRFDREPPGRCDRALGREANARGSDSQHRAGDAHSVRHRVIAPAAIADCDSRPTATGKLDVASGKR